MCWGREYIKSLLSAQFCCESKSALKLKFIIKQTDGKPDLTS